jgi:hypothetical protein
MYVSIVRKSKWICWNFVASHALNSKVFITECNKSNVKNWLKLMWTLWLQFQQNVIVDSCVWQRKFIAIAVWDYLFDSTRPSTFMRSDVWWTCSNHFWQRRWHRQLILGTTGDHMPNSTWPYTLTRLLICWTAGWQAGGTMVAQASDFMGLQGIFACVFYQWELKTSGL